MKHIIRKALPLVVMMLSIVGAAFAGEDNGKVYFQKAENFDAYSMGNGKIHFKVLIFANGDDHNHNASRGDGGDGSQYSG